MEWCTVWKGSVSDCLGHLHEKHGGSQYVAMNNLGKFFPPWTVPRDVRLTAFGLDVSGVAVDAQLFHKSGCRLVHKYRIYRDPIPHQVLLGRVLNTLRYRCLDRWPRLSRRHVFHLFRFPGRWCHPGGCLSLTKLTSLVPTRSPQLLRTRPLSVPRRRRTRRRRTCRSSSCMLRSICCFRRPPLGPGGTPSTFYLSASLPGWFTVGLPLTGCALPSLPVSPIPKDSPDVSGVGWSAGLSGQSGSARVSGTCSTLAVGPGGPFSSPNVRLRL